MGIMGNKMVAVVLLGVLLGALAMFMVPPIMFIIGSIGAMIAICFVIAVWKFAPRLYPITVHIYTDKYGGMSHDYTKRGRRIRDKADNYFIELTNGDRIKDPGRKWAIDGDASPVLNVYTSDYKIFHPFEMEKVTEGFKANLVNANDKQWIADQYRINKRITDKPMSPTMEKLLMVMPVIIVCIMCGLIFLMFSMGITTLCGG